MKKIQKLMALSLAFALCASSSLIASASTSAQEQQVLAAASAKVPGISTFAAQGKISDFFPNRYVAQAVAIELHKKVDDVVPLWDLMSNVKKLSIPGVEQIDTIDGMEYLYSMESLSLSNIYQGVNFGDTLNYSKNLKVLDLFNMYKTSLPEGLVNSGIQEYKISYGISGTDEDKPWGLVLPQSIVDAANKKTIKISFGGGLGTSDYTREYQLKTDFNVYNLMDPLVQSLMDIHESQLGENRFTLTLSKKDYDDSFSPISLEYSATKYNTLQAFLQTFNQQVNADLKTSGDFLLTIYSDSPTMYYHMPLTVTKAALSKPSIGYTYASNGAYVIFKGSIDGHFTEGVNNLAPDHPALNNVILYVNSQLVDVKQHLLSCSVTVKNDEIISMTFAGLAEPGNFGSFFMATIA